MPKVGFRHTESSRRKISQTRLKRGLTRPLKSRFWSRVSKPAHMTCWVWIGLKDRDGYGLLDTRSNRAHRISWEIHKGRIPSGLQVLHKCDNPSCVRPSHLYVGTHADNMRDRRVRNRTRGPQGEVNVFSKLTTKQVIEMRRLYRTGRFYQWQLAKRFGVTKNTAQRIISGHLWPHIPGETHASKRRSS